MSRRRLWFLLGGLALIAVFVAVRRELGIELDPESIRAAVDRLGFWGPLAYVAIVALRIPLGLPSGFALVGGGLVFGFVEATLYGATGLLISAVGVFLISRWVGRETIESRVPARLRYLLDIAGSRVGALFVALGTAYPLSPLSSFPIVAGITSMAVTVFTLAAAAGSVGRAGLYAYFGSRIADADPLQLLGAGALFVAAAVIPLAFATPRAWVFQAFARRDER